MFASRKENIKVTFPDRCTVDITYQGRTARFNGELGMVGFWAFADSMQWITPQTSMPASDAERQEVIQAVKQYYGKKKDRVFFVDQNNNEV